MTTSSTPPALLPDTKRCSRCKQEKARSEFSRDRKAPDGLLYYCRACNQARVTAYQRAHPDQTRRAANTRMRRWRSANPERVAAKESAYRKRHPERFAAKNRQRYARKLGLLSPMHDRAAEADLRDTARLAAAFTGQRFDIDHIIPLARGGMHHHHNLRVLPARLNYIKQDKLDHEVTDPEFHAWLSPEPTFDP